MRAVDLFCGAGGASLGLARACETLGLERPSIVAIDHNPLAVETHRRNHPWAEHHCVRVESLDPVAVAGTDLDILVAGPECTHHANARGGAPMSDQSRASAWHVVQWAERLRARDILVENVAEFRHWGPLNAKGRPIKSRRGETFQAWLNALDSLGYRVDWRILDAADYGDPQRRRRIFIRARAFNRRIEWPAETHAREPGLFGLKPWRTAREVIDWDDLGPSIWKPDGQCRFGDRTMARIREGIRRYCGDAFIAPYYRTGTPHGVDETLHTITTRDRFLLVAPFLVPRKNERPTQAPRTHSLDAPLPAVTATGEPYLVTPFLLPHEQFKAKNGIMVDSVDDPLRTIGAHNGGDVRLVSVLHDRRIVDIRARLLTDRELARGQSFPDEYEFVGNKAQRVQQIGNAWPQETGFALCESMVRRRAA